MGTNYTQYLQEAYRVLKNNGILKIAEVWIHLIPAP